MEALNISTVHTISTVLLSPQCHISNSVNDLKTSHSREDRFSASLSSDWISSGLVEAPLHTETVPVHAQCVGRAIHQHWMNAASWKMHYPLAWLTKNNGCFQLNTTTKPHRKITPQRTVLCIPVAWGYSPQTSCPPGSARQHNLQKAFHHLYVLLKLNIKGLGMRVSC